MRSVVLGLLVLMNATAAEASPLVPGRPAGLREAQVSSSFMVFSGVAVVAAGAGYLFSSSLGGSTTDTIIAINGGTDTPTTPNNSSTSTTGTP
jgi:hypothetical protein